MATRDMLPEISLLITERLAADDEPFLQALFEQTESELRLLPPELRRGLIEMQYRSRQAQWTEALAGAQDWILLKADGFPVGRCLLARTPTQLRCVDLAVLPAFQRQGIATAALQRSQDRAARNGLPLGLRVAKNNLAQRLYERLGFRAVSSDEIAWEMVWTPL